MTQRQIAAAILASVIAGGLAATPRYARAAGAAASGPAPLIPREVLLGNPDRIEPTVSPDGKRLAWRAPDQHGVLQVWVRTIGKSDDRMVTAEPHRGIGFYRWSEDPNVLVYLQDHDGDENYHLMEVDLQSGNLSKGVAQAGKPRDLTPWPGVKTDLIAANPKHRDRLLIALNRRDRRLTDVYVVNLVAHTVELAIKNPGDVSGWIADDNLVIRGAIVTTRDGGTELRVRDDANSKWRSVLKVGPEDQFDPIDFSKDGKSIFVITSVGTDTSRVAALDLASGAQKDLAHSADADVAAVMMHPTRHVVQAVGFDPGKLAWTIVDPSIKPDFDAIAKLSEGEFRVADRDVADRIWIVDFGRDRGPRRYYLWDRARRTGTFLFASRAALEDAPLAAMEPLKFAARDRMQLHAYLTLPLGVPAKNLPTVLLVHGGPWARDRWGYNGEVQMLANRGYAVLQVEYRGSTGFGKKYLHAGDRQWGLKMQDDLTDGANWAIAKGIADPKRIAIEGGSYGGYAALAGATFTPDLYSCAIDAFGPSNLFTLLSTMPPYWVVDRPIFMTRVGDPDNPADKALLTRASPLFSADRIKIPMLIAQGANDVRVKPAESEQIVAAIKKHGGRATYVVYSDEGHGFARPENRLDFEARAEQFLAQNLGGRSEPMNGDRIPGSTAVVTTIGKAE